MMEDFQQVIDMMGRTVKVPKNPKRIISLVPSQTELLYDLGLDTEVVGITKFCVHPTDWFKTKKRVGGTKQYRKEVIKSLQPDLIIGNKEENEEQQILDLAKDYPVWMSDISTIDDAYEMIHQIGGLTNTQTKSSAMVESIQQDFKALSTIQNRKKVAYFIWKDPYMVAANGTFIHEMLFLAGFDNVFADQERYPTITLDDLKNRSPEIIFLSSEPFPFKEEHINLFKTQFNDIKIEIVDGELFSWYGSRMLKSVQYFEQLHK